MKLSNFISMCLLLLLYSPTGSSNNLDPHLDPPMHSPVYSLMYSPVYSPVHSTTARACRKISNKLASVSYKECINLDLKFSEFSEKKFPILLKEFAPIGSKQPKGKILLIGGIHGDEYSSVSVVFKWLAILQKYHSGLFHWKISPLVNPDGLLQKKSQRMNANQVDLNRNFPSTDSAQTHTDYWHKKTHSDPRKYPGKAPLSEKESQWLVNVIDQFKPDVIVSVHAPYGLVDFDGKSKPPAHLGPLHLHLLGTYPGSLGRYGNKVLNVPVITVELQYAGIMPKKSEISKIWRDLIIWLRNYLTQKTVHSEF